MANIIQQNSITSKIQNELWERGIKCFCSSPLCWFTDMPIHKKSINIQSQYKHQLTEPYMTSLGYKTAEKFLEELRKGLILMFR